MTCVTASTDIKEGEWIKNGGSGLDEREMSYIRPLNASMGPKETLCNIKDESEKADPEAYYADVTTTQTPVRTNFPCVDHRNDSDEGISVELAGCT